MKKLLATLLASTMALSALGGGLVACGTADDGLTIKVWAPADTISAYEKLVEGFKADNPQFKDYRFKFENKEESDVQQAMADPKAGAHVFFFPSDHLGNLAFKLKCLQPLTDGTTIGDTATVDYVSQVNKRDNKDSVDFVTKTVKVEGVDKELVYAFPATDDNGYFLWYDKTKLTTTDVATWDGLIAAVEAKNSKIMFNYGNSYYAPAFFFGTDVQFDYTDNELKTYATDVDTTNGKSTANVYWKYFNPGKIGKGDAQLVVDQDPSGKLAAALAGGQVIAGVGGTWITAGVKKAFKDLDDKERTYDAVVATAVLPTFTMGNQTYHMGSFIGGKYCGVNSYKSKEQILVSLAFANYLTGEKGQEARYDAVYSGPTNKVVAAMQKVVDDPILKTYRAQKVSKGRMQKDQPSAFWEGINNFVKGIVAGTTAASEVSAKIDALAADLRK